MKKRYLFLLGGIIGVVLGWIVGFLRWPTVADKFTFGVGFVTCLATVSLFIAILFVWNKNVLLRRLIGKGLTPDTAQSISGMNRTICIVIPLLILLGSLSSIFVVYRQNRFLKSQVIEQQRRFQDQSELIESVRKSKQVFLLSNLLNKVDDELKHNPDRKLSESTIARIATMSFSLKPYHQFNGDSLADKKLSPERGQLLLALLSMNIDSTSFSAIKHTTSFSMADLRGANLKGIDLSEVNLQGANLQDAELQHANLDAANLTEATLWGANMSKATLRGTVLRTANLKWVNFNQADLSFANLNGVDLTGAKLRMANLQRATLHFSTLSGVLLNEADLTGTDLVGANLSKANMSRTILNETRLNAADLSEANLTGAQLTKVAVEKHWFENLAQWKLTGGEEILQDYQLTEDTSWLFKHDKFFLKKTDQ